MEKYVFIIVKYFFMFIWIYSNTIKAQDAGNLLFKSSFNQNVIVDKTVSWNHHLNGLDLITGYTFPDDLPGDNSEHFFNYVIGDYNNYFQFANAEIVNTTGHDGNPTNALYLEFITDDTDFVSYSRVQYAMYGNSESNDPVERLNKGYVKYMIKKHFNHNDLDWALPIEWKDMNDNGFRMGLYIYDTNTSLPYWVAKGQYMIDGSLGDDVWQVNNYDIAVPEDEWFKLEVYWYGHPDSDVGKLKVAINDEILFDITNQTKDPNLPNKMFYFMPFKVYGTVGHSWITDFEYWDNPPSNSILFDNNQLSINDFNSSNFIIYPNPIFNKINFSNQLFNTNYQIFTISGKIIKKGIIENKEIDLSEIKRGVYFIKILDKDFKTLKIRKLVKN